MNDVVIIYAASDGRAHRTNANRRRNGDWLYSKWDIFPQSKLNALLKQFLESGYTVIDERVRADIQNPGMSAATPIIAVAPDVQLLDAMNAVVQLHKAILESEDDK